MKAGRKTIIVKRFVLDLEIKVIVSNRRWMQNGLVLHLKLLIKNSSRTKCESNNF